MRTSLTATLAMTALLAGGLPAASPAVAAAPTTLQKVSPAAGWEVPLEANHSAIGERFSSPAVGDIDGNGVLDIVAGFPNGRIYAWRADNGVRWLEHWTGPGAVQASPALVDYDGDGRLDIVFANTHGDVGVLTWDRRTIFYARIGDGSSWGGAFATPAVADIDDNGTLDVVVSGLDQRLHAWGPGTNPPELPGFPVPLGDTSWSSPAIGDVDADGRPEIVVGWDCDGAPGQTCSPDYGGYVGVFSGTGRLEAGWPRFVPKQVVWSSPALADIDVDGRLDVIVGTGNMNATMWDGGRQPMRGTQVFAWRGDGSDVPGWPVTVGRNVTSSPAVGDVTGDGRPEVAFVAEDGLLYAYSGGGTRLWARCAGNDTGLPPNDGTVTYGSECPILHASPSIADVVGDTRQEVLVGGEQWMHVFDGSTGAEVARGETAAGTDPMTATPTVANVGGRTWITAATTTTAGGFRGRLFAWTTGRALGRADWPTFKAGAGRLGSASVRLVVGGAIGEKYAALGGEKGFLGKPLTNEYDVRGGRAQRFAGGDIYWSAATGAHEVHGAILSKYLSAGATEGSLGLPVTDETPVASGRVSRFQGGDVYWSQATGAQRVQGSFWIRYGELEGPTGPLGFPVSEEYPVPGGVAQGFERARLYWTSATGPRWVRGGILGAFEYHRATAGPLGFPTTDEVATPTTPGAFNHFTGGSLYWSPGTGAHAVWGAIRQRWSALGWEQSALGFPTTSEVPTPRRTGAFNHFQNGSIYWSPTTGAHDVRSAIRDTWQSLGWENGPLGFPVTGHNATPRREGAYNHFENGSIYWSPATGAREVHGAIRSLWAAHGWENGALGFPTTNETPTPRRVGAFNHFENGSIYWSPTTGAHQVLGPIRDAWAASGWENGPLGFPTAEASPAGDGRVQVFEHGRVVESADGRTTIVLG